jgi:hypothetical protein
MAGGKPPVLPIFREEAARHGLSLEQLINDRSRKKFFVRVRQYAMWRARTETGRSLNEIARFLDMDHTTVLHGCNVMEAIPPEQRGVIELPKSMKKRPPTETYLGKPCVHGHSGLRYVSNGGCVTCNKIKRRKQYYQRKLMVAE